MTRPPFLTAHTLEGTSHGFFGRKGGVSTGLYASLNAGTGSNDAAAHIAENRVRIQRALGAKALLSCFQIHSADVIHVTTRWDERPRGDAMVTRTPGLALCILTADCTPVLFADRAQGVIGAAHAGWKGAIGGVLEATIDAMEGLGADRANIRAVSGPTIQQASYEVGPEFRDTFLAESPDNEAFFLPGKGDRLKFDLPGYCRQRLDRAGLSNVLTMGQDTCALDQEYFSNRRRNQLGQADYGRNASVILLKA